MTAMEQIEAIGRSAPDEVSRNDIPFLLRAFKMMREIAMEYDRLTDDVFNERMK